MSRILITGSTDGLGYAVADALLSAEHNVVVRARNPQRAGALDRLVSRGAELVIADFTDRDAVRHTATELDGKPPLDTVIHNGGVWSGPVVAAAAARLYPDVLSNAVDPGWVPTKMGGPGAPDDLELGHQTQKWLALSHEAFQDRLLQPLAEETGTGWEAAPAER